MGEDQQCVGWRCHLNEFRVIIDLASHKGVWICEPWSFSNFVSVYLPINETMCKLNSLRSTSEPEEKATTSESDRLRRKQSSTFRFLTMTILWVMVINIPRFSQLPLRHWLQRVTPLMRWTYLSSRLEASHQANALLCLSCLLDRVQELLPQLLLWVWMVLWTHVMQWMLQWLQCMMMITEVMMMAVQTTTRTLH